MIDIDQQTARTLNTIIRKHLPDPNYQVFVFGSRATNIHRKFSDIDIGISSVIPVPSGVLLNIEEELENSDIPYLVDVVDFSAVSHRFKNYASQQIIPL